MTNLRFLLSALALVSFTASADNPYHRPADDISKHCESYIAEFDAGLKKLVADDSAASYTSVSEPLDNLMMEFLDELLHDYLVQNVHTDEAIRKASTDCTLKGFEVLNSMNANRALYDRITEIDTSDLPADKSFSVDYWKEQFQISGIGKDEETRNKIKAINDEISEISNTFRLNINNAVDSIKVKAERLAGAPDDYLESHPADEDGLVTITTAYSDISPIYKYVHDASLRKEVYMMSRNRAMPDNQEVLLKLLNKRQELADILGHDNFAEYNMLGTMVKTPANVVEFTAKLSAAIEKPVAAEKARLLKRMKTIDADADAVRSWHASYLSNIIREQEYELDAKEVREYFHYDKVRDGIVSLTEDLFDLEIKPYGGSTWHEDVEAYEVFENDTLIGRMYLDSHPREGKFTHAAQFGVKMGKKGVVIPEGALLMNFPKGLMEHGQVETFLHEFGHLIHWIFAGQNDIANSRFQDESDFGEAPSTMLEEWVWDYETLSKFATNDKGEVIPPELVKKMNRARYFGQAVSVASQLTYTALSFDIYNRNPEGMDLAAFEKDIFDRYSPYGYDEGTHMHASFGHLAGYGAKYYTYQWSNSIAEELLSRFKKEGLRNKKTAADYRYKILAKTGTQPASELVKDFLGRDFSVDAYAKKLSKVE
ncbi:MAG: M3 family metallopeptidase [Pseudomonadota bacterium]